MTLDARCQKIELILSDVDGVLTDGGIVFDNQGIETKRFHVRDGLGIRLWRQAGFKFGIITSRTSQIVRMRAAELGIDVVRQGFSDKLPAAQDVARELNVSPEQVCYIGDDLPDLPPIRWAGLGVAVADGAAEVRAAAAYVTNAGGGHAAVRETVEIILKSKVRWEDLIRKYTV
jgi:3-deoxy-D-manno-octulosonate 8-phosphate phosphatase (KDO 8-P phosphatase)